MTLINLEKAIEYSKEKDYIKTSSQEEALREVFEFANVQAVLIPDNATNGDVIKALFPNIITDEFASTIHATTKVVSNGIKGGISYDFWKDWWNAPYQKGGKE